MSAVLVVHSGEGLGWLDSIVIDGVRLCSEAELLRVITSSEPALTTDDVISLALRASDRSARVTHR